MASDSNPYADIHYINSLTKSTIEDLRLIIQSFPIIDNHAHNLLLEQNAYDSHDFPFESITSEAQGHALHDHAHSTLAHSRGIKQLAEFFNCPPTLQDVKAARHEWIRRDYASLIQKCLQGTHAILIDDGLSPEVVNPVTWHKQFVPTVSRIVRIEAIAADILEQLVHSTSFTNLGADTDWNKDQSEAFLVRFNTMFRNQVRTLAQDTSVRGFKSVVCYRSGLDVGLESRNIFRPHQSLTESALLSSFHEFLKQAVRTRKFRIQKKAVNDYLVVAACDVLDKLNDTDGESLPIQFHTGLGDADIDLITANPAYMKPLITAFPHVDFVLLHASYPYTKEAGYLASTFANAWLDIGEIFPMLSRDGQEAGLRHALQYCPTSKILWSTDGHFHPETYYLANLQFRQVLEKILTEYLHAGDISVSQAINISTDILFWNSNQLYKLDEERKYPQLLRACGRGTGGDIKPPVEQDSKGNPMDARGQGSQSKSISMRTSTTLVQGSNNSLRSEDMMGSNPADDLAIFEKFMEKNPTVKYIWMMNYDNSGTSRLRMIPIAAFRKHISTGKYPGITCALPNLLANDTQFEGSVPTGEIKMVPDLSSLCINSVLPSPSATVQAWWMQDTGDTPTDHHFACPRWALQKHVDALKAEYGISMLMGFEVEILFMRPLYTDDKSNFKEFIPLSTVHSWSNLTYPDIDVLPMIEEIVEQLADIGIVLDQFHTEAAPGQWEFPLPAFEPVKAIDVLYKARDIIRWVAHKHGLKATLYPRPFNFTCGSASHTHFSVNGADGVVEKYADPFLSGILENLPSILAFTLPIDESYARVSAGIWAGGEWVCWGTQNREVPLRKCGPGHWELKSIDGVGNMYLSMAALVASGLHGVRQNLKLTWKDNLRDASLMSGEERKALGITTLLPKKLSESLSNLDKNGMLKDMMGDKLIDSYIKTKQFEMETLDAMDEKERKRWLIARY